MTSTRVEESWFEPTVMGAVRRYRIMVLVIVTLTTATALSYATFRPPLFRADATVMVPPSSLSEGAEDRYLDGQVLMLRSQRVADRAVEITNATMDEDVVSVSDFYGEESKLEITPPDSAQPGSFGSSLVSVAFSFSSPRVAQVATNAVLQAFDEVRTAELTAQGKATVAGIESALADARTRDQRAKLVDQRTATLVKLQIDLSRRPSVAPAVEPRLPVNGDRKRFGAAGVLAGAVLGAGLAYTRASRRRVVEHRLDGAAIYEAPVLAEVMQPRRAGALALEGPDAVESLPVGLDPRGPLAAEYRFAAGVIDRARVAQGAPLGVAVVATDDSTATATVTANVVLALADSGCRVLAVDADPSGSLTALLLRGEPPEEGVEQVLSDGRSVYGCVLPSPFHHRVTVLGSTLLAAGRPPGAVSSGAVGKMMSEAKAAFDVVVIDCPSPLLAAEASDLVSGCDATVVVVTAGEPVRDHLSLLERLRLIGVTVIGYVHRPARRRSRPRRSLRARTSSTTSRPEATPAAQVLDPVPGEERQSPASPVAPPVA